MRMLSRPARNWNQEFTFDSELAEILGVENQGIPLFLFFPRSTLAVYIGVMRLFRARAHSCLLARTKQEGTRKTRRKRVTKIATVYHHQVDGYPDDAVLFTVTVQIHVHVYSFSFTH